MNLIPKGINTIAEAITVGMNLVQGHEPLGHLI
jgi:hypothetical protein